MLEMAKIGVSDDDDDDGDNATGHFGHADRAAACELTRGASVCSIGFSPNGLKLVVGTLDKKVAIYDVVLGVLIAEVPHVTNRLTLLRASVPGFCSLYFPMH